MKMYSFWRSAASFRVRIALNLKGLQAEVVDVHLDHGDQHSAEYRAVNPQRVLPSLAVDDGPPLIQSLAILEYLDETHPRPPLLPKDPRAKARVRAIAQIVACDHHPLIVPRVRSYLEKEFGLDEAARLKWIRHWFDEGLRILEEHLSRDSQTGKFCHGDAVTIADLCLVSHVVGAQVFGCDVGPHPTVKRIADACLAMEAFAKAHPRKQPGAPATGMH